MKKNTIVAIVIIIVIIFAYFLIKGSSQQVVVKSPEVVATTTPEVVVKDTSVEVLGKSVGGRDITAYHYGTGATELLFVGGIHGGYEWNTALVAYQLMDYLKANPTVVPTNVKVTVIPVLNPDGLTKVVGTSTGNFSEADVATSNTTVVAGRFNGNNVDLNRNFDCDWQAKGKWQTKTVSGGSAVFSEPESQAIKNYVEKNEISAVVTWYSSANGVFSSSCHNGVSAETSALTKTYAKASGYPAFQSFDFYATTGDMVNWFAKNNIPAISVLLTNHSDTEWDKNRAGVEAVLKSFSK